MAVCGPDKCTSILQSIQDKISLGLFSESGVGKSGLKEFVFQQALSVILNLGNHEFSKILRFW